jgi:hypothetical protein
MVNVYTHFLLRQAIKTPAIFSHFEENVYTEDFSAYPALP